MGTAHYMAPEQIERPSQVDQRADLFSLGVVFYEMLTGELPLGRFDPPSHTEGVDPRLDDVVLRALAKTPQQRHEQVREFRLALESIASAGAERQQQQQQQHELCRVPFRIKDIYGGLASAHGVARLETDALSLEFQVRDELGGLLRSSVHRVRLALDDVASVVYTKKWSGTSLTLHTTSLGTLEQVPTSEADQVKLSIGKENRAVAQRFADAVQRRLRGRD